MKEHLPAFELPAPDIGRWRAGNTGTEGVWCFDSGTPGREVLVTALVHGNEVCGAWALKTLLEAGLRPRRGALTLAFCNLAAFDRFDAAHFERSRYADQDLNRVWGTMAWRAAGARSSEQRRALELLPLAERADWLLDLHSMHNPGPPLVLTGLQPRNIALARELGMPALVVADAGHAEGCRLRDHGRFGEMADNGTRSLLIECGFHGELPARAVAIDMLGRFLVASGALDAADIPAGWLQTLPARQAVLEVTEAVVALDGEPPRFAQAWATGQRIERAGTLLGWNGGREFHAPYDGCTLIMPSVRQARPGLTIVRLARDVVLEKP
ncbi:MAG: succinylglutamate desuccinylase/aspartoacylase family protein [Rubrivivax sp.]